MILTFHTDATLEFIDSPHVRFNKERKSNGERHIQYYFKGMFRDFYINPTREFFSVADPTNKVMFYVSDLEEPTYSYTIPMLTEEDEEEGEVEFKPSFTATTPEEPK